MVTIRVAMQPDWMLGNLYNVLFYSIEDDFITWKDKFWPAVCEHYGIESTGEDVSVRQYRLQEFKDEVPERLFTGEMARLHSIQNQRP